MSGFEGLPLRRGVVVKTMDGNGVLFAPGTDAVTVAVPEHLRYAMSAACRFPVAYRADDPRAYWFLDIPQIPVANPPVPGVPTPVAPRPVVPPGPAEVTCPAPSVDDYLGRLRDGAQPQLELAPTTPLLQAFLLRAEQLTHHEFGRILRLARANGVTDDLIERVFTAGRGKEHSYDAIFPATHRFYYPRHTADERILAAAYVALMHLCGAVAARAEPTPVIVNRTVGAVAPPSRDDLLTALAPWVSVCGPIAGVDVPALADPLAPYAVRAEAPIGAVPPPAPARRPSASPAPPRRPMPSAGSRAGGPLPLAPAPRRAWWQRLLTRDEPQPGPAVPAPPAVPDPAADRLLWDAAIEKHDGVLRDYLAYEIDPRLILSYPAILDVQVPQTRAFHEALERATALRTDSGPQDSGHARAYVDAVTALGRAWQDAERHCRDVGRGYLPEGEARSLDRAAGLLAHAGATSGPESETYRLAAGRLLQGGALQKLTPRAAATLERAVRGELEA